jgi:glycosyltransferase involved in cell wall biosynthesis
VPASPHHRVVVDARMPGYTEAGISRYVKGLLGGLAGLHPDRLTALLARCDRGDWWGPLAEHGVDIGRAVTPCHHRLERWMLPLEVAHRAPALFHAVDHVGIGLRPFPTVVTVHDLAFWRYPWTHAPRSRRHYAAAAVTLPAADAVICVSAFIRDELLRTLPLDPRRVHVVHNGLDAHFAPRPDRSLVARKYGLERPYILALGTVEERKSLLPLLDALRRLEYGDIDLAIAGADGWGAAAVWQRVADLGLASRVHRLGRVDDRDLVALYSSAELLAFPSLYEGFAFPPLEAMACGTPVVAVRRGPLPEVCGDGPTAAAELVAPTAEALANGIQRVLGDARRREELIAHGRQRAARFSWARCAEETWAVYRGVVHSPFNDA